MTAFSSDDLLNHPQAALADAILSKPVTTSTLYNAVSPEDVGTLVSFMEDFAKRNG